MDRQICSVTSSLTTKYYLDTGELVSTTVNDSGLAGATVKCLGNPSGCLKLVATAASSVGLIVSEATPGLSALANGMNGAAGWTGLPDTIVEGSKAVGLLADKKERLKPKTWASVTKTVAGALGFVGTLDKAKVVQISADGIYIIGAVKNVLTLVSDVFTGCVEFMRKPHNDTTKSIGIKKPELLSAENREIWAARVKIIVAFVFHIFLAIGAIFLIPLSPITITVLAVAFTAATLVHHYLNVDKEDHSGRMHAGLLAV